MIRVAALAALLVFALSAAGQPPAGLDKPKLEAYVRHLLLWGPQITVTVADPVPAPLAGFHEVRVTGSFQRASLDEIFYVSLDGRKMIRGTVFDLDQSPFAAEIAKLKTDLQPSLGTPGAKVVIVAFSDFQCSYCRKFWRDTLPRIEETYIRTGKVRFVYRHLALLGPPSVEAALAAECAHAQGKFWPYHDRLFASGGIFALSEGSLKGYAKELGMDAAKFSQCVGAPETRETVERETMVARAIGMTGTPAFLINGGRLIGAQPYEVFEAIFEQMLQEAGAPSKEKR